MKNHTFSLAALVILLFALTHGVSAVSAASPFAVQNQTIIFKVPKGVMAGEFAGEKRPGMFMLYPDNPAGIYVTYSKEGETADAFIAMMKTMSADMLLHDEKSALTWTAVSLPKHDKIEDDTDNCFQPPAVNTNSNWRNISG